MKTQIQAPFVFKRERHSCCFYRDRCKAQSIFTGRALSLMTNMIKHSLLLQRFHPCSFQILASLATVDLVLHMLQAKLDEVTRKRKENTSRWGSKNVDKVNNRDQFFHSCSLANKQEIPDLPTAFSSRNRLTGISVGNFNRKW